MYYRLNDDYAFRGFKAQPFAIVSYKAKPVPEEAGEFKYLKRVSVREPFFFTRKEFECCLLCDGVTEISEEELSDRERGFLRFFTENGVLDCSAVPAAPLSEEQKYRYYDVPFFDGVTWSITGRCNYRCKHCLVSAHKGVHTELSLDECERIADELHNAGIMNVMLTGGEPLVRKDFFSFVDILSERNIRISEIMTNGKKVDRELIEGLRLRGHNPKFQLSFDGLGWHDWLRGVKGAEQDAIRVMKLLQEMDVPLTISMCVHRKNIGTLRENINFLAGFGVKNVKVCTIQEFGEWAEHMKENSLSRDEFTEAVLNYIPQFFEDGSPVEIKLGAYFRCKRGRRNYTFPFIREEPDLEHLEKKVICTSAIHNIYISENGSIMPCLAYAATDLAEKFPSLLEMSLNDALQSDFFSKILYAKRKEFLDKNEKCRECERKLLCCGGCPAVAMADNNDYLGIDEDVCYLHKNKIDDRIREVLSEKGI